MAHETVGGRYRSLFVVGRGGMGSVEAALSTDGGDRVVALKRLLPEAARDRRRVDMFLREAKLAAMLDHPNVVRAYDYGEIDGELYLAMEYVEGQPLSRLLRALGERGETLSVAEVAYMLGEVCRGLHAAHELTDPETKQSLNLVHRDVSPQNVMLGYDGRVRLLDFGVAKIETESVTKTGEVKGKTAYMSPEQAMGDPLDRRSDLFGVGALLYECLALKRMWGEGTDMEMIRKLALDSPPPLSKTGRADVPPELDALYTRLVARDRKDRPASAAEVAKTLDALVPDRNEVAATLRTIVDAHFAEQAEEQRRTLMSSLNEALPQHQAEAAVRDSAVPSTLPAPPSRPLPSATEPPKRLPYAWLGAGAVIAAVVGWRLIASTTQAPKPEPVVPVTTVSSATPSLGAPPTNTAPPSSAAPEPSAAPPPVRASARPPQLPPPSVSPRPKPSPSVAPAAPAPKPTASAKAPDVDDHPF